MACGKTSWNPIRSFRQIFGGGYSRLKQPEIPVEVYVVKVTPPRHTLSPHLEAHF